MQCSQASEGRETMLMVHDLDSVGRLGGRKASVESLGTLRSPQENKVETLVDLWSEKEYKH